MRTRARRAPDGGARTSVRAASTHGCCRRDPSSGWVRTATALTLARVSARSPAPGRPPCARNGSPRPRTCSRSCAWAGRAGRRRRCCRSRGRR